MELNGRCVRDQKSRYSCLLFDLDDTLYPLSSGISDECTKNIEDYMIERLGIEESKVTELSNLLYKHYGTTMAGLRAIGYDFDYDDYHNFIHGRLPYGRLKPDPTLRSLLQSLVPFRKLVFTNADKIHAAKVLNRLGVEDCFDGIICFETLNPPEERSSPDDPANSGDILDIAGILSRSDEGGAGLPRSPIVCKPSEEAIEQALKIAGVDPRSAMFFDDSTRNILAGKRIGLHTVLIGSSQRRAGADHAVESIHNVREALPELWEGADRADNVMHPAQVAIETTVTA